jgi:hypothetical protein
MIKIITRSTTITRNDTHLNNVTATASEVYIKFPDGIEISIPCELSIGHSNMINNLKTMTPKDLTLDFTDPKHIVKLGVV